MAWKVIFGKLKNPRLLHDQKRNPSCLQTLLICATKETFRQLLQKRDGQRRSFLLIAIQGVRLKHELTNQNFRRSRLFRIWRVFKQKKLPLVQCIEWELRVDIVCSQTECFCQHYYEKPLHSKLFDRENQVFTLGTM